MPCRPRRAGEGGEVKEPRTPEGFMDLLRGLGACWEAKEWADGKTLRESWNTCERGDWMLWLAARVGADRKRLVLAACACARLSLKYVSPGEDRPRVAIETAEKWAHGEATIEEVKAAAAAYAAAADAAAYAADAVNAAGTYAAAAAYAAYAADAVNAAGTYAAAAAYAAAADAAAYAAYTAAADAAADAAAYAADAAGTAAYAADAAAYAADDAGTARTKTLRDCADILRTFFPALTPR